jgi:hypothetical protein
MAGVGDEEDTLGREDCLATTTFLERGGGRGGGLRNDVATGEPTNSRGLLDSAGDVGLVSDVAVMLSEDCPLV